MMVRIPSTLLVTGALNSEPENMALRGYMVLPNLLEKERLKEMKMDRDNRSIDR